MPWMRKARACLGTLLVVKQHNFMNPEDTCQLLVARYAIVVSFAAGAVLALMPGPTVALMGGTVDRSGAYRAVVIIFDGSGAYCSATKIAPRRFLTAGHCVVDRGNGDLLPTFRRGATLQISNAPVPRAARDVIRVYVQQTQLPPAFKQGLQRCVAYKQVQIADFSRRLVGAELQRRIESLQTNPHFTTKYPDAAVITLQTETGEIPQAQLDLNPLRKGDTVTLVGYGCDDLARKETDTLQNPYGVRRFGTSDVIRVDPVNFYSFGRAMRPDAPSLCPGDSGGPVLRNGSVVGIHGTVHGVALRNGANSNMSVNLSNLATWPALDTQPGQ